MGNNLYDNLLKATNNIDDITTEKYGVITKLDGIYCSVKETDNDLEHNNVPILNGANLSVGDKVILGFLNNSIYDVVCYGALDKQIHDDSKQDLLVSGTNIKTINHQSLLGNGNITIEGGGTSVDIVTDWETTPSDTKVPSEKLTKNTLDTKVDKVTGKGLSSNDYTLTEKTKLGTIETNANYYVHPSSHQTGMITESSALTNLETDANATQHEINLAIDSKINTSGNYMTWDDYENDLSSQDSTSIFLRELDNLIQAITGRGDS